MSEINLVHEEKYTGKFEVGNEVRVVAITYGSRNSTVEKMIGKIGVISTLSPYAKRCSHEVAFDDVKCYPYEVTFGDVKYWFNEAELELVETTEREQLKQITLVELLTEKHSSLTEKYNSLQDEINNLKEQLSEAQQKQDKLASVKSRVSMAIDAISEEI